MSHGGAGRAGRAQSQLKKRGAWGQEWARGHGAMGPWGYGAMSHGRERREGRRGQACTGAKGGEGAHALSPQIQQTEERGRGQGGMEPWDHRAMAP